MPIIAIIPARFGASRFPGKPLVDLCGKPMIQRVWEQACKVKGLSRVLIATDDRRILQVAHSFGAEAVMTPASCPTGTDRIAIAARKLKATKKSDLVLNIQGDEPLLPPAMVTQLIQLMKKREHQDVAMGTLSRKLKTREEYVNPNVVKAVATSKGRALYFSRASLPYLRNGGELPKDGLSIGAHIGLYAYRGDFLQAFTKLKPTPLEKQERLEQLRALESGYAIAIARSNLTSQAVDTPADAAKVRKLLR